MFYLSRAEQIALFLLLALLLTGGGVLIYGRGQQAGRTTSADERLFIEAPVTTPLTPSSPESSGQRPQANQSSDAAAGPTPADARTHRSHGTSARPTPTSRISLNSATAAELDRLPGIGPVLAERIVQCRERLKEERGHGFESVDELLNVPGIGPKRFAAVRELVTL